MSSRLIYNLTLTYSMQGDRFQIGVTDSLTDNTMELSTSIVRRYVVQSLIL